MRKHLRIFLVDDHDIVRQGLRDLLSSHRDIYVVGDSGSARRAIEAIPHLQPDVVLMDLQLQDGSGIGVCRAVRSADPSIRVLLLTSAGDDDALVAAVLAGAAGYLIKLTRTSLIVDAGRKVGEGRDLLDAAAVDEVGRQLHTRLQTAAGPVTVEESRLLGELLAGRSDQQIADRNGQSLDAAAGATSALIGRLTGVHEGEK
jgi:two-component system response regulator DevR